MYNKNDKTNDLTVNREKLHKILNCRSCVYFKTSDGHIE